MSAPALTPEEWDAGGRELRGASDGYPEHFSAYWNKELGVGGGLGLSGGEYGIQLDVEERQALAALCLHEQPFGFTRVDVGRLREMINGDTDAEHLWYPLMDLADRIEALLPPEES